MQSPRFILECSSQPRSLLLPDRLMAMFRSVIMHHVSHPALPIPILSHGLQERHATAARRVRQRVFRSSGVYYGISRRSGAGVLPHPHRTPPGTH